MYSVCRDFAHLAITLCRCMNIPARYCTGYLGGIGVPADTAPMDFSAWFEVFMGGRWMLVTTSLASGVLLLHVVGMRLTSQSAQHSEVPHLRNSRSSQSYSHV